MMRSEISVTREVLESIAAETVELVLRKNHDYANAWAQQGLAGIAIRLNDKLCRVEHLSGGGEVLVADEKLDATLDDIIGYYFLEKIYLRWKRGEGS